jgi:hypothetical protein
MKRFPAAMALAACMSGPADAAAFDIHLDGYCNIYHVTLKQGLANAQDTPSCSGTFGGGLLGTVHLHGKTVVLAIQDASSPGVQRMLELSYPFTGGGTFKLYETTNGTNFHLALDGTYSLVEGGGPRGTRSVTARGR